MLAINDLSVSSLRPLRSIGFAQPTPKAHFVCATRSRTCARPPQIEKFREAAGSSSPVSAEESVGRGRLDAAVLPRIYDHQSSDD
jgi:hypothetical protein